MDFEQKIKSLVDYNLRQQQAKANVLAEKTKNSVEILTDFLGTDVFELFKFLNKTYYGEFASSSYPYKDYRYRLNLPESLEVMMGPNNSWCRSTDKEGNIKFWTNLYGSSTAKKGIIRMGVHDFKPYVTFQYKDGEVNTKWTDDVSGFIQLVLGYVAMEISNEDKRTSSGGRIREVKNFDGEFDK